MAPVGISDQHLPPHHQHRAGLSPHMKEEEATIITIANVRVVALTQVQRLATSAALLGGALSPATATSFSQETHVQEV